MASPFLAGFPGGLMQGLDFGTQQALRQLQLKQAQQQMLQTDQQQQALGVAAQALRQVPQQPTGFQQGAAQDITTSLTSGFPQGNGMDGGGPPVPLGGGMPTDAQLGFARRAMGYGYPPAAAAGMAGSMTGESGPNLDPYNLNPTSGALGEAQWLGPRKAALLAQPDPYSRGTQDQFLFAELRGPEAATGQRMMRETDPAQAARDFTTGFERPGNVPTAGREKAALAIYRQLDGAVGQSGGKLIQAGVPAEAAQASTQAARAAGRDIDPSQWGIARLHTLMQAVDKAAPGAPDAVKMLALGQLNKLAAPEDRMMLQAYMKENQQQLQIAFANFRATEAERRSQETTTRAITIESMREAAASGRQERGAELKRGQVSDLQAEWVANYIQSTGSWPVGSGRNQALQNKVEQLLAEKGIDPTQIGQAAGAFKADQASLVQAKKLADAASSYEATAMKNLQVATDQIHKVAPTDWGPWVNKWIETGETFAGNPNVPSSVAAVVTLANEYAKVMSGATGAQAATDSSRREAAEVLNPYFSKGQWDAVTNNVIIPDMRNRMASLYDQVDIIQSRMARGGQPQPRPGAAAPSVGNISTMTIDQLRDLTSPENRDKLTPEQSQQVTKRAKELLGEK